MNVRVVSKSGNKNFALDPDNIIVACWGATAPDDAKSYAIDHVKSGDGPAWVYDVELTGVGVMKEEKTVVFVPASQAGKRVTLDSPQP